MAKISVIIPVYGVENYLEECLDSILNQKMKDLEIILIDDGGKDNCPQIIDRYAQKDNRIITIHKENGGYGQSCNVGLEIASGEYISIIEPDDYIDENMFSDLYPIAKDNDVDIIKTPYILNYQGNESRHEQKLFPVQEDFIKPKKILTLKESPQFLQMHPSIWSCLYKNEFIKKHNIKFEEAPGAGWTDNPFQVQTMCLADKIYYHNKPYYYWRVLKWCDLKDFNIPMQRTEEIHKWLFKNNIDDVGILSHLCKREITYFEMINKIISLKDIKKYHKLYRKYFENIQPLLNKSDILTDGNKNFLKLMYNFLPVIVLLKKIRIIRKKIISLQFNNRHKYLYLFGNYVLGNKYD